MINRFFAFVFLNNIVAFLYEELAFHLEDSHVLRAFARLNMGHYPSASTLQENIKAISEEAWEEQDGY